MSASGAKKQGGARFKLDDFLPDFCKDDEQDMERRERKLQEHFKKLAIYGAGKKDR